MSRVRHPLQTVREDPFIHWVTLAGALIAGILLAQLHWLGLVAGGALVGLVTTSLLRALLAGVGFGITVLFIWAGTLAAAGSLGNVSSMGELAALGVGIGIAAPVLGSLVRGVI